MKSLTAAGLLSLALLAPSTAFAQEPPYRASGTEPFWGLTIGARTMRFEAPGRQPVEVATPKVIHGFAGEMYQTRRVDVNIVHRPCSDGMSDRRYPDSVTVTVDGRRFEGCGGLSALAEVAPVMGDWRVLSIGSRPPVRGTTVTLNFRGDRVSGNTGCNSLSGSFAFQRGTLTTGPLITTKRACLGRYIGQQEQRLLQALRAPLKVQPQRNGRLVLRGARNQTIVLAPDRPGAR